MFYSTLYGLNFASDFPIPILQPQKKQKKIDVIVRKKKISTKGIVDAKVKGKICQIKEGSLWLSIPKVARYLVLAGKEIHIDSEISLKSPAISLYLLGSCLGALLQQRNILALHGTTVLINKEAHIFCGPSGIGKSTLAASFAKKGFRVFSDDISMLNCQAYTFSGVPQVSLLENSIKYLNLEGYKGYNLFKIGKKSFMIKQENNAMAIKVRSIYFLYKNKNKKVFIQEIKGISKVKSLIENIYRPDFISGLGKKNQNFTACVDLANQVRIMECYRPQSLSFLDELISKILEKEQKNDF